MIFVTYNQVLISIVPPYNIFFILVKSNVFMDFEHLMPFEKRLPKPAAVHHLHTLRIRLVGLFTTVNYILYDCVREYIGWAKIITMTTRSLVCVVGRYSCKYKSSSGATYIKNHDSYTQTGMQVTDGLF